MRFLLDPPLSIVTGVAIAFIAEKRYCGTLRDHAIPLSIVTVALFWCISGLLYLDCLDFPWLGKARSGRHFMWNSGVELLGLNPPVDVSVTYQNPFCTSNIAALPLLAAYPLFLYVGLYAGSKILSKDQS